ncbi:hypothetical protein TWF694_003825 [Orbilia ellipsospora]|uniref:NADH:ubiquinone oxidoreductase intermediate-associated protein 30 domain-containing protein n=1 Tax=Orbilia ellipsospora TaxID=2528407 RepID=A0AAV9X0D5_9PEZI
MFVLLLRESNKAINTDDNLKMEGTGPVDTDVLFSTGVIVIDSLFGGERKWSSEQWTASDDRVRGGRSQSHLRISNDKSTATFCGNLDIEALGGAGFASQRTTKAAGGPWDFSEATGLVLSVGNFDDRIYTFILKNEILPKRPDGREQSTISYEFSFSFQKKKPSNGIEQGSHWQTSSPNDFSKPSSIALKGDNDFRGRVSIYIPWEYFEAYYRGKKKPDAKPLDISNVQRMSIMCRSMFGTQHGHFSIDLKHIFSTSTKNGTSADDNTRVLRQQLESDNCSVDGHDAFPFYRCTLDDSDIAIHSSEDLSSVPDIDTWDLLEDFQEILTIDREKTA